MKIDIFYREAITSVQFIPAKEAVAYIKDNDTVAVDVFIGAVVPEEILRSFEERFVSTGTPKNLTFVYAAAAMEKPEG